MVKTSKVKLENSMMGLHNNNECRMVKDGKRKDKNKKKKLNTKHTRRGLTTTYSLISLVHCKHPASPLADNHYSS